MLNKRHPRFFYLFNIYDFIFVLFILKYTSDFDTVVHLFLNATMS